MLEFGSKNIFLSNDIVTTSFVINSYQDLGTNCVFFCLVNSNMYHWINCKKVFYRTRELQDKIKSNSFRADLLIFEGLNGTYLERIKEVTDLPICLVGDYSISSFDDYDFAYLCFGDKSRGDKLKSMFVTSLLEGWESSLEDLITQHKRNIKLNDLGI